MPIFDEKELKRQIARGEIRAVVIDTNTIETFSRSGQLSHPKLRGLGELRARDVEILVPDVVADELHRHMLEALDVNRNALVKQLQATRKIWPEISGELDSLVDTIETAAPRNIVETRLGDFFEHVGAVRLKSATYCDIGNVLARYHDGDPPFANAGKKTEFPDAIALSATEGWAELHGAVLAISNDNDWQDFCDKSPLVTCAPELGRATSLFWEEDRDLAVRLLDFLADDEDGEADEAIASAIEFSFEMLDFEVVAESDGILKAEPTGAWLVDLRRVYDEPHRIVASDANSTSIALQYEAAVGVSADFSFKIHDPYGNDDVTVGIQSEKAQTTHVFEIVVTVVGKDGQRFKIAHVEVSPETALRRVDFDWVEYFGPAD